MFIIYCFINYYFTVIILVEFYLFNFNLIYFIFSIENMRFVVNGLKHKLS